jgi:hypothetical protein
LVINANINSVQIAEETRGNGVGMEVCNKTKRMNFISVGSLRIFVFSKQITMKGGDISECEVAEKSISTVNDQS